MRGLRYQVDDLTQRAIRAEVQCTKQEGEIDRTRTRNAKLLAVLKELEWVCEPGGEESWCPCCGLTQHEGHSKDCDLGAALKAEQ